MIPQLINHQPIDQQITEVWQPLRAVSASFAGPARWLVRVTHIPVTHHLIPRKHPAENDRRL